MIKNIGKINYLIKNVLMVLILIFFTFILLMHFFNLKEGLNNNNNNINFGNCSDSTKRYNGYVDFNPNHPQFNDNVKFSISNITNGYIGGVDINVVCDNKDANKYYYRINNQTADRVGYFTYNGVVNTNIEVNNNGITQDKLIIDLDITSIEKSTNTWKDKSGNENHFSNYTSNFVSTPILVQKPDNLDGANSVYMDGNNYLRMTNANNRNQLNGSLSYEIWVYPSSLQESTLIYENGQKKFGYWCDPQLKTTNNGTFGKFTSYVYPSNIIGNGSYYEPNKWYQVVMVYDNSNKKFYQYVNGILTSWAEKNPKAYPSVTWLMLGSLGKNPRGCANTSGGNFKGYIGAFRAYDKALSEDEVKNNYETYKKILNKKEPFTNYTEHSNNYIETFGNYLNLKEGLINNPKNNFNPKSIHGLALWFDASDMSTDTTVSIWFNKSVSINASNATVFNNPSNTPHAISTINNNAPTYNATGINGKPAVSFNDSKWLSGNVSITNNTMTIFAVCSMNPSRFAARIIGFSNRNGSNDYDNHGFMGLLRQSNTGIGAYRGGNPSGNFTSQNPPEYNTPYLFECWYDGTSQYSTVQMGEKTEISSVPSTGNFAISYFTIGHNPNKEDYNAPLKGLISEILVYRSCLSDSDRKIVEGYLSWKWGIQENLPSSHPYYNPVSIP